MRRGAPQVAPLVARAPQSFATRGFFFAAVFFFASFGAPRFGLFVVIFAGFFASFFFIVIRSPPRSRSSIP